MLKLDPAIVARYIGDYALIGISFQRPDGSGAGRRQVFGQIVELSLERGMVLRNRTLGEEYVLPPMVDDLKPAEPGDYQLADQQAIVQDPDWIGELNITIPSEADFLEAEEVQVQDELPAEADPGPARMSLPIVPGAGDARKDGA